jgi:hypothetical protein
MNFRGRPIALGAGTPIHTSGKKEEPPSEAVRETHQESAFW